ncbi:DUF2062 domain-containing protein [Rufibacter tibetensis]|uniref:DUF2062 domain-containing protein n=1 Tax=Rufibacter tibetensis TaxID=512763 RepID=A0A0P0D1T0_9BACT|nr:DUF2062 domain-containing protein [Rufibacter tibetensis]ALJ00846.1 hypothetical protein DC20_19945 [Rufibacter tibetensis]
MKVLLHKNKDLKHFIRRKLWEPVLELVKQGITPHQMALTITLGAGFGIIPFIGLTTILCTFWALRLRLNVAFTILIGYLMQPVQLALYVPFVELGQSIIPIAPIPFSLDKLTSMFRADWLNALQQLWLANMVGIMAWLLCFIPFGFALYFSSKQVLSRVLPVQQVA